MKLAETVRNWRRRGQERRPNAPGSMSKSAAVGRNQAIKVNALRTVRLPAELDTKDGADLEAEK